VSGGPDDPKSPGRPDDPHGPGRQDDLEVWHGLEPRRVGHVQQPV